MGTESDVNSFLPLPVNPPIRTRRADSPWSAKLTGELTLQNDPPVRRVLLNGRVIGQYAIGSVVEERLILIRLVQQGFITAEALAAAVGVHRNTLGNWAWRERYFGVDGLAPGRLPGRRAALLQILQAAGRIMDSKPRTSAVELGRQLKRLGFRLPSTTVNWLRAKLLAPQPLRLDLERAGLEAGGDDEDEETGDPGSAGTGTDDRSAKEGPPDGIPVEGEAPCVRTDRTGGSNASTAEEPYGELTDPEAASHGVAPAVPNEPTPGRPEHDSTPETPLAGTPEDKDAAAEAFSAVAVPVAQVAARTVQHGGLGLMLPYLQPLLDPLEEQLQRSWGSSGQRYGPRQLVEAFLYYVLAGFLNPEQTKAAPARDFGPLLGSGRAPACGTLRRRLSAMAAAEPLITALQRELALQYLRLGWVQPGWWLVDGHFSPYFGQQEWAKGWWAQRRMPQPGYQQDWVHDRRGRPLCMHFAQAFELFADQLPVIGAGLQTLLREAGQDEPVVLVFDRGGYGAPTFTALNALGIGWVTWLKGHRPLPADHFTQQAELPVVNTQGRQQRRTVAYCEGTHRVEGCHDHVYSLHWHDGNPEHQVALLSNLDRRQPGAWSAPQLIAMIENRWPQENSFKGQTQHVDLDWCNGYAHQPAADTPVPNPEVRRLKRRLGQRVAQQRRAMDRAGRAQRPSTLARCKTRLAMLKGQITRLTRRIQSIPATVPYSALGRTGKTQMQPGRGTFFPVLRALAFHLRLQSLDRIAQHFPDHRERDKVLRVLIHTPGRWLATPDGDWLILRRPHLPRYAAALSSLIDACNQSPPRSPAHPDRPLRFALEIDPPEIDPMHNAPVPIPAQ